MTDKKNLTRAFEAELRSLPVELVPPDPAGLDRQAKQRPQPGQQSVQIVLDSERGLVDKLIARIKRI
jgi:hypothetical protein